jgi:putative nucleotidyltransferase with HDIG domain
VVPYHSASVQLVQNGSCVIEAFRSEEPAEGVIGKSFKISENKLAHPVLYEGKRLIIDDVTDNEDWIRGEETIGIRSWMAVPLQIKDQRIGVLTLDHKNKAQYTERDATLAMNFANQAAITLENSRLLEEARQRLYRIESLRQIDLAISGSMDLEISMNVLVRQLITSLDVDAATVLIYNKTFNNLNYISGHGFTTESLKHTKLRIGEGLAGRAALQKEMVVVKDLAIQTTSLKRSPFLSREKFVSYIAYPLVAKGQIVGVLEVFHRSRLDPDDEWFSFLGALAGQAAIAIDRINLYIDLENSNLDLTRAYDATIEGWAKAIELRDRETEGHSRRVVDLSLKLAMRMGVSGEDLLNIRRGALLHDIGKMAIPDGILLKPGKLTEDEWEVMKEHPVYALQMLSPIEYLRDALDIPYFHHERWDGTGYPQGLGGEEIPLAARIFAVIDVWDALQSDRPYRPAWSEEQAIDHIREMSGSHFDPTVASEFLEMVDPSRDQD